MFYKKWSKQKQSKKYKTKNDKQSRKKTSINKKYIHIYI